MSETENNVTYIILLKLKNLRNDHVVFKYFMGTFPFVIVHDILLVYNYINVKLLIYSEQDVESKGCFVY